MHELPEVLPGQVWADCDPRSEGRTIRVNQVAVVANYRAGLKLGYPVDEVVAECTVLTDAALTRRSNIGRIVHIRVERMRPTKRGFRLLTPAP